MRYLFAGAIAAITLTLASSDYSRSPLGAAPGKKTVVRLASASNR